VGYRKKENPAEYSICRIHPERLNREYGFGVSYRRRSNRMRNMG
jgi:hypothetical protein